MTKQILMGNAQRKVNEFSELHSVHPDASLQMGCSEAEDFGMKSCVMGKQMLLDNRSNWAATPEAALLKII
ncbi:hypothetical protein [Leptolyngbya sp. FACHB-711]|uniref:hypothetical protein n=1 Tax=unclassified Leptolyngbya TaxID=2650499 RepID=UPI00168708F0|nr:hypothetical protein [Leptolyngbya sp. FACHB-711]MBD1853803.1 hypothetical protein [Cyanobacteria bacterium FACHB-502]MBD2027396.1 hypothetical protein [Leptolyngbya sp. FACHB-711]